MGIVKETVEQRPGFFAARPACQEQAIPLNDFIYMSQGMSNAYLLVTPAGRVVINTGLAFEAPVHKRVFDQVCPGPTPYILLTQGHVDHLGGVGLFREPGTQLVAQRNLPLCQRDDQRIKMVRERQAHTWFRAVFSRIASGGGQPRPALPDAPVADVSFDDRLSLEVGGRRLELLATPGGETIDSCVLWLPDERILFSGNVFGPLFPHFPNFNTIRGDKYRLVEPYLDSLRRIRALAPEVLITGHFDPVVGAERIRACLDRLEAAVSYVHDETLKGMNSGKDIWTLMREVRLPEKLYVGEGYGKVSWAVRTIWETYMGWFKAQATSELYPTRPRDIQRDLVELAGIGAVLARGRQRLAAGDPEAALLFAEAALAADPADHGTLVLARDSHQALLDRSGGENFWETGWLKSQIEELDARLRPT
jgi:glyoxylase-like metal-dependent hydrolase (beta-lactamase superfamily II)